MPRARSLAEVRLKSVPGLSMARGSRIHLWGDDQRLSRRIPSLRALLEIPMTRRPLLAVALAAPLLAVLAACAAAPAPATTPGGVTIENCGVSVTFDTPPERVVTIKSTSTEMMRIAPPGWVNGA